MYFVASLVAAAAITIFLVSKISTMLHAKRPGYPWVLLATLVGVALASLSLVPLNMYVASELKPIEMMVATLIVVFVILSISFKYINKMNWSAAITTNIANIVIGLITVVAAVVLNGESLQDTYRTVANMTKTNTSMVQSVVTGEENYIEEADDQMVDETTNDSINPEMNALETNDPEVDELEKEEPVVTELDLLPPRAAREVVDKKSRRYVEPKYHVISLSSLNSVIGKSIKIHRKNGSVVSGSLIKLLGNDVVISQRLRSGAATTPISMSAIKKLEVYR